MGIENIDILKTNEPEEPDKEKDLGETSRSKINSGGHGWSKSVKPPDKKARPTGGPRRPKDGR